MLICGKISAWEICPHPPAWRQPVEITRPTNMIYFMAFIATTPVRDRWQRQTLFFFSIIIFRLEQEEKSKSDLNKGEKSEPHLTKKMTRYSCLVFGHSLIFEQPHQSKNLGTVCVFRTAWECNQGVWSNLLLGLFSCSFLALEWNIVPRHSFSRFVVGVTSGIKVKRTEAALPA